jgi:hypothetical protein
MLVVGGINFQKINSWIYSKIKQADEFYYKITKKINTSNSWLIKNFPFLILIGLMFLVWIFGAPELTYWNVLIFRIRNKLKNTIELIALLYTLPLLWFNRHRLKLNTNKIGDNNFNWQDIILILATILIGLSLRIPNLDHLDPYTDEYSHLNTAKSIVENNWQTDDYYSRGFYLVSIPVAAIFEIFGISLFNARLVGVIINVIAIIPLYLIGKKISKSFAFLISFLFATSPWIVATSRNVREYAYYPLIFFLVFLVGLNFLNSVPHHFRFSKHIKQLFNTKNLLRLLFLVSIAIYAIYIDPASTLKIIFIFYLVLWLFFLTKFDLKNKQNWVFLISQIAILYLGVRYLLPGKSFLQLVPQLDRYWWGFFYPNSEHQWYGGGWQYLAFIISGMALYYALFKSKQKVIKLATSVFLLSFYFYLFHFDRYHKPRYLINVQFWYIIFFGVGVYLAANLLWQNRNKFLSYISIFLLFLNIFSWKTIQRPMDIKTFGYVPITNEYHDNVGNLKQYIQANIHKKYEVCLGTMGAFLKWNDLNICEKKLGFNYRTDALPKKVIQTVEKYNSGVILLDYRRGTLWINNRLPQENFRINETLIEFLGNFDGNQLYVFDKSTN